MVVLKQYGKESVDVVKDEFHRNNGCIETVGTVVEIDKSKIPPKQWLY